MAVVPEEARLLAACRTSRAPWLLPIVVERLLLEKSRHKSVEEYRRIFERVLIPEFGKNMPLAEITASADPT